MLKFYRYCFYINNLELDFWYSFEQINARKIKNDQNVRKNDLAIYNIIFFVYKVKYDRDMADIYMSNNHRDTWWTNYSIS